MMAVKMMRTHWKVGLVLILMSVLLSGCSAIDFVAEFLRPTATATPGPTLTPTPTKTMVTFNRYTNTPSPAAGVAGDSAPPTATPIPTQTLRPSWTPLPSTTIRPTWTTSPTLTPSITLTPTDTPEVSRFLYETFSDQEAAWLQSKGDNWSTFINKKGFYEMAITEENVEITSSRSWLLLDEVRMEAEVAFLDGEGYAGFNCRESTTNYYTLFITSDGQYGLGQTTLGKVEFLILAPSSVVRSAPGQFNHLRAECRGNTLTLWVNGVLLAREEIEALGIGYAGMMIGTRYDFEYVTVIFDNFQVWGSDKFAIQTLTPTPITHTPTTTEEND